VCYYDLAEKAAARKKAARIAKAWAIAGWGLIGSLLSVLLVLGLWVVDQLKGRGS
jgi:hypothetical protein